MLASGLPLDVLARQSRYQRRCAADFAVLRISKAGNSPEMARCPQNRYHCLGSLEMKIEKPDSPERGRHTQSSNCYVVGSFRLGQIIPDFGCYGIVQPRKKTHRRCDGLTIGFTLPTSTASTVRCPWRETHPPVPFWHHKHCVHKERMSTTVFLPSQGVIGLIRPVAKT